MASAVQTRGLYSATMVGVGMQVLSVTLLRISKVRVLPELQPTRQQIPMRERSLIVLHVIKTPNACQESVLLRLQTPSFAVAVTLLIATAGEAMTTATSFSRGLIVQSKLQTPVFLAVYLSAPQDLA